MEKKEKVRYTFGRVIDEIKEKEAKKEEKYWKDKWWDVMWELKRMFFCELQHRPTRMFISLHSGGSCVECRKKGKHHQLLDYVEARRRYKAEWRENIEKLKYIWISPCEDFFTEKSHIGAQKLVSWRQQPRAKCRAHFFATEGLKAR